MRHIKGYLSVMVFLFTGVDLLAQDTLIIQENEPGQCTYDGTVVTSSSSISGWTGDGFIDAANGVGVTISWQIQVPAGGEYQFAWRYAFGGTATNYRDAKLVIDGNSVIDTVIFPYTGSWNDWEILPPVTVNLGAGDHKIRLEALYTGGIANIDYFMVTGNNPLPATCTPQYVISVASSDTAWGSVWFTPIRNYYDKGTLVTLHANAAAGYFFESWTGAETSNDSVFTFSVQSNVAAVARFLPNGTAQDPNLCGYATVQDDNGTTYLVTGGALGDSVVATTLTELQTFLGDSVPRVVKFTGELSGNAVVTIKSNKTLEGIGTAHLRGIGLSVNQARNVIVRDLTISHVQDTLNTNDAFEINGGSQNIWIDHCEFYSDRDHDKDYYDGLLDIKNGSTFITVSWSVFHDHYKACLVSSGDEQYVDTVARLTFHHNYFYNCESRLPMIRFGRAHIYNNYYRDCHNAIDSRMGAWLRIEGNYFDNVYRAVFDQGSTIDGRALLINNYFGNAIVQALPECNWPIPYVFDLDSTGEVPAIVTRGVISRISHQSGLSLPTEFSLGRNYPNPFNSVTSIKYTIPVVSEVCLEIFDLRGRRIDILVNQKQEAGNYQVYWNAAAYPSGIYFYKIQAGAFQQVRKCLLLK